WFLVLLIVSFVMAGTGGGGGLITGRWGGFGGGGIVGFVVFFGDCRYYFGAFLPFRFFFLFFCFCFSLVFHFSFVSFFYAASLLLLFLYSSSGGRLAILGRERDFFCGLLLGCEITVGLTVISYFVVSLGSWGNPNSLGLVTGTVMAPLLLWGILVSETRPLRW